MGTVSILINLEDYLFKNCTFKVLFFKHRLGFKIFKCMCKMSTICNKQTTSSQHVLWWGSWVSIHIRYHVSHCCKCDMWHFFCIACLFENQPKVHMSISCSDGFCWSFSSCLCTGTPCSVTTTSSWRRRRIRWRPTWSSPGVWAPSPPWHSLSTVNSIKADRFTEGSDILMRVCLVAVKSVSAILNCLRERVIWCASKRSV